MALFPMSRFAAKVRYMSTAAPAPAPTDAKESKKKSTAHPILREEKGSGLWKDAVIKLVMDVSRPASIDDPRVLFLMHTAMGRAMMSLGKFPQDVAPQMVMARIRHKFESLDPSRILSAFIIEWMSPWMPNTITASGCTRPTKWAMLGLIKTEKSAAWHIAEHNHYCDKDVTPENAAAIGNLLAAYLATGRCRKSVIPAQPDPEVSPSAACIGCKKAKDPSQQKVWVCCGAVRCDTCSAACGKKCPECGEEGGVEQHWAPCFEGIG